MKFLSKVLILFVCLQKGFIISHGQQQVNATKENKHDYKTDLYWKLNDSPMQQKLRNIKPFPVSVVYYQQRDHNLDSIRKTFKTIKSLGFTSLKQIELKQPGQTQEFIEKVFHTALDEGLYPWYYGSAGWMDITPALLKELKIKIPLNGGTMPGIQMDNRMIDWQMKLMRKRIDRMKLQPPKPREMGEPGRNYPFVTSRLVPAFTTWLRNEYRTIDSLKDAWAYGYTFSDNFSSFEEAAESLVSIGTDAFGNRTGKLSWSIRPYRDAMRFQADLKIQDYKDFMNTYYRWDADEPNRTGGHQLFENQALNGWDLEGQAHAASIGGSFYASIHLAHHFFLVDNEITRPVYIQARTVADMFKGGWAATWESTGGPTQWSGYQGFSVDGELIKKLMFTYVAAGLKGIGFWTWNSRDVGWEAGEYALTDLQGMPTDRARVAGEISKKLQEHRFELWEALDEPLVGVLYSWENEAILGRLSQGVYNLSTPVYQTSRDAAFRQYHAEAKIGISRALINHNIPFEYVTERDLEAGLAARYKVIYLPCIVAIKDSTLQLLEQYMENGGQIVADMPLLLYDNFGRLNKHRIGTRFEKVFGFQVADYGNTFNKAKILQGDSIEGQFAEIKKITHGKIVKKFDDGSPAVMQAYNGKGTAIVMNFEASRSIKGPGNDTLEKFIIENTVSGVESPFKVEGKVIVYRRSAPHADHYFIINEGEEVAATVTTNGLGYKKGDDVLGDIPLQISENNFKLVVPKNAAVWVRLQKTSEP